MNVIIFGAAGFIGTNLAIRLSELPEINLTLVDKNLNYFDALKSKINTNIKFIEAKFDAKADFDSILRGQDFVFHMVSTSIPATSNTYICEDLSANVNVTALFLDSCVRTKVKRVVFISSGGTVYGKSENCPLNETMPTYPISSYGLQKITIEKLLYLYSYIYDLDYRIVRLSNPYGPYQRPNGLLGAVTTFVYKSLKNDDITVYGDGSVIRDFIYIDDAIEGIVKIAFGISSHYRTFNLGSGKGTSINELLKILSDTLRVHPNVKYELSRAVDVPENYLDITRYEENFGKLECRSLSEGIIATAEFLKNYQEPYLFPVMKKLSLIIPTSGVTEWMTQVVESIYSQGVDESLFEVVITDNGESNDCKTIIEKAYGNHSNLRYIKTDAKMFMNQIDAFKAAEGLFIKFVNHRSLMLPGSIQFLLDFVDAHKSDNYKPIIFFMNSSKKYEEKNYDTFDGFIAGLSYFSSWSGGLAVWKEDFNKLPENLVYDYFFPHLAILCNFTNRHSYSIKYKELFQEIPSDHSKKGNYKLYYAFGVAYPTCLLELLRADVITASTFLLVKRANEKFIRNCYVQFNILNYPHSYNVDNAKEYLEVFYSSKKIIKMAKIIAFIQFLKYALKRIIPFCIINKFKRISETVQDKRKNKNKIVGGGGIS